MELNHIQRKKGELNLPLVYLLVAGTGALLLTILYLFDRLPHLPCVFKTITGYPCPTCGSTRIMSGLIELDILSAFRWNPLLFLAGIAFIAWVFYGFYMLFSGRKIRVTLTRKESLFLRLGLVILFILNWIYLAISGI
ncbi:MAG: DUF2752 domain-containing protein [Candidatus Aminicenantes bacterium]|nr:MAG: DUF2752 domain-containing protein [Candidatus Aminicenantes bacterium]